MASFFQKVDATLCTGEKDATCDNFVNRQRLPSHRRNCDICGSKVTEITRPDAVKIGIASLVLALTALGTTFAVRGNVVSTLGRLFRTEVAPGGNGGGGGDKPTQPTQQPALPASSVQIESDSGNLLSLSDLEKTGAVTYRARQSYRANDKFRLRVERNSPYLYVYYRSGPDARRYAADNGAAAFVPSRSDWFQMDGNPGVEEFIIVSSKVAINDLDQLGDSMDPSRLESAARQAESTKEVRVVRIQLPHQ